MVRNQPQKKVFTSSLLTIGATMQKSFIFVLVDAWIMRKKSVKNA